MGTATEAAGGALGGFEQDIAAAGVLVVDDEPGMRNFLAKALRPHCARIDVAASAEEASGLLDTTRYDVVIVDNVMPKKSGIDWLAEQQRIGFFSDAILMTAYADLDTAIAAMRAGASDFLLKPFRSNEILKAIGQSLQRSRLKRQNSMLNHELKTGSDVLRQRSAILGSSPEIEIVRQAIERTGRTNAACVIRGEVGSGKQVAARMLHAASDRASMPFFWLQAYGMTEDDLRQRLFGQIAEEAGGEPKQDGILLNASGGTLFVDEVEMLSLPCQNVLFELLSTGRFQPLGAARSLPHEMRIVTSTTQPLQSAVDAGRFRADLFYLLNVVEIVLPPLRERASDVIELARFFLTHLAEQMGVDPPELTPVTQRKLLAHTWPGNVMELHNFIERALIHNDFEGGLLGDRQAEQTDTLAAVEQRHILQVLDACGGNRAEAARRLGLARKTIDRKCQSWGL